jgi:hypothetical protein
MAFLHAQEIRLMKQTTAPLIIDPWKSNLSGNAIEWLTMEFIGRARNLQH